jgi:hypothetical protein
MILPASSFSQRGKALNSGVSELKARKSPGSHAIGTNRGNEQQHKADGMHVSRKFHDAGEGKQRSQHEKPEANRVVQTPAKTVLKDKRQAGGHPPLVPQECELCQIGVMARGWESKDVESQREDLEVTRERETADQAALDRIALQRERESIQLSRARVLHDLEQATHPRHRASVEEALRFLDAKLAELDLNNKDGK